ncbi:MAG: hypothetical protein MJY91_03765 [Bacteroidales bacterium]|nr:hypothetical protein [Bacteroidales bacterium]
MDFTLKKYRELLAALDGYGNVSLRHDVDLKPQNSLKIALTEHELGWQATYYFRAVPESWDEDIIREIAGLGHEIGYHYESLTTCNGDQDAAWEDFKSNLARLEAVVGKPVTKICMHGSPKSKWDSRDIWKKYEYRSVGVEYEPYLDTDFSRTFYLTDTGRRWDGFRVSVRDRVPEYQDRWEKDGLVFHSTDDVIRAVHDGFLPHSVMITTHPQRWNDSFVPWLKELLLQNAKNLVKRLMIMRNNA